MKAKKTEIVEQEQVNSDYEWLLMQSLSKYKGQWIAISNKKIIARDTHLKNVIKEASSVSSNTDPLYIQVPNKKEVKKMEKSVEMHEELKIGSIPREEIVSSSNAKVQEVLEKLDSDLTIRRIRAYSEVHSEWEDSGVW
ncbi:MAG: hypothetical protein DRJ01_14945 [Bacteroidetes bacterium]|nr:MAG: hypothetical protein DRJ01_14945 [Bacteroidota bacterium]